MVARWPVNISPAERVARLGVGVLGVAVGVWLLTAGPGPLAAALEVLLILAGLDMLVTGALGHCPLYQRLGHLPAAVRRVS